MNQIFHFRAGKEVSIISHWPSYTFNVQHKKVIFGDYKGVHVSVKAVQNISRPNETPSKKVSILQMPVIIVNCILLCEI